MPSTWVGQPSSTPLTVNGVFRVGFWMGKGLPTLYACAEGRPTPMFTVASRGGGYPVPPGYPYGSAPSECEWFDTPEGAIAYWELLTREQD